MNGERRIAGFVLACLVAGDADGALALDGLAEPLRSRVSDKLASATDSAARAALLQWARRTLAPSASVYTHPAADPGLRRALRALGEPSDAVAERAALLEAGWPA